MAKIRRAARDISPAPQRGGIIGKENNLDGSRDGGDEWVLAVDW
ncbi:MAG: hypothetical protein P8017_07535 [Deltaproteobacteria bacterium]